jgi:hypothetical protein
MKAVLIISRDQASQSHMDWEDKDTALMTEHLIHTVGFLRPESEKTDTLELVMSYSETEICGRWAIPKCCIVSVTELTK